MAAACIAGTLVEELDKLFVGTPVVSHCELRERHDCYLMWMLAGMTLAQFEEGWVAEDGGVLIWCICEIKKFVGD